MDEIDTTELLARLLAVMPPCWLAKLTEHLEKLHADTGYGDVVVIMYRGRIVQMNRVIKER